jgi:hypothetical protein
VATGLGCKRAGKACVAVRDKLRNLIAVLASVAASLPW